MYGFDALRLRDVSQAAGVSIGLIQHYFTTRDESSPDETMRVASERRAEQWTELASGHTKAQDKVTALLEGAHQRPPSLRHLAGNLCGCDSAC